MSDYLPSVDEHLQVAYAEQYKNHDIHWRMMGAKCKVNNILAVCRGITFTKVLEVGCGDGAILYYLDAVHFAPELHAVDISATGIQFLQKRNLPSLKSAQVFDGYRLPFQDNEFDLVILSHVLEHVEFERILLREIKRVSRFQVIEIPRDYRYGVDCRLSHFLGYGHINLYTPSSFRFLLLSEHFRVLKDRYTIIPMFILSYMNQHKSWLYRLKSFIEFGVRNFLFCCTTTRLKAYFSQAYTVLVTSENEKNPS